MLIDGKNPPFGSESHPESRPKAEFAIQARVDLGRTERGPAPELQRLLNWKRLRAPFWPYFFRSCWRASRVKKPSSFSLPRSSELNSISARAIPSLAAPACPEIPPPSAV